MSTFLRYANSTLAFAFSCACGALGLSGCQELPVEPMETVVESPAHMLYVEPKEIPHTITVARSSGYGFWGSLDWTKGPYYGTRGTFFADVNADDRADVIVVNEWGVSVRRAPGSYPQGIDFSGIWIDRPFYGTRGTFIADVTGDRLADAIVVNDWGVVVRRSTRMSFGPNDEIWISGGYYGTRGTYFIDVTGPDADAARRADAVVVNDGGITVRRSTGSGFGPPRTWFATPYYGSRGTFFADVNCDGRADAIAVNADGIYVLPSADTTFVGPAKNWTTAGWGTASDTYTFADVDANGCDDAIRMNSGGVWVRRSARSYFMDERMWTPAGSPFIGDVGTFFADIDADFDADAIAVNR